MNRLILILIFISPVLMLSGQNKQGTNYWNRNTQLIPWRLPIVNNIKNIEYIDLDGDGKPDVLKTTILDGIPIMWIDDSHKMKYGDLEGNQVNGCLLVDLNKDGIYGGPDDLCIDWIDNDGDGVADIQLVVSNGGLGTRNFFDWSADYMCIIDYGKKTNVKNFINWNEIVLRAWEHNGHCDFYTDYHGNVLFLKMHASSFRMSDLRYSWENPFIFYDEDGDGLSEMSIRLVDTPQFRPKQGEKPNNSFDKINPEQDILFTHKVDWAAISWDLDNDNGPGNEFDFDISLKFSGPGFDYSDQVHKFKNMRGLPAADKFFYDPRWRQNDKLIYTDPKVAYSKIFKEGKWNYCWFVFDEDDDCNRWERVEFYEPKDLWKIGMEKGGLDNNKQADAVGDRGEFDTDFSGKGNLYIAPFDGRLHLYGAEWGAWRVDMSARSFQGYGGLYPPAKANVRDQIEPKKWATVRYSDTNNNGFIDCIEYDLDGDQVFEEKVSLLELGIDDKATIIETEKTNYKSFTKIFSDLSDKIWSRSQEIIKIAKKQGVSTVWYAFWQQPRSMFEKYQYGYWLSFYLYKDMCHIAEIKGDLSLKARLDKAFYSGNWKTF